MAALDTVLHLLSFFAPALAVACLVALARRFMMPGRPAYLFWWAQAAINSLAGGLVLVAGLWYWGVDGKMTTYLLLVVAIATCEWACARGWRSSKA
jgi:hypothetical protein